MSGGLLLGKIYEEAGLPAGVLNVVIAKGSTIGDPSMPGEEPGGVPSFPIDG